MSKPKVTRSKVQEAINVLEGLLEREELEDEPSSGQIKALKLAITVLSDVAERIA